MIRQRVAYSLVVACALAATSCATAPPVDRAAQAREAQIREAQKRESEMREAQAREAQRLAEIERERAAAEERRQREPQTGKVTVPEPVAAQPLAAIEEKPVEPAAPAVAPAPAATPAPPAAPAEKPRLASAIDYGSLALQLSRDLRALRAEVETLQTLHTPRGWVLSVDAAELFPAGEAGITPEAARKLDPLARVLAHYAARGIVIDRLEGEDNVAESLAASRAEALRTGLEAHGIPAERIAARTTGERLEFLVPNDEQAFNAAAGR
jgi:outer membrane protein OmpA-like peptidoglycan-associated protein